MSPSPRELHLRPLPPQHTPYALPRTRGAGRTVAPAEPFADPTAFLATLDRAGDVRYDPSTGQAVVHVAPEDVARLAPLLSEEHGTHLHVTVRLDRWPVLEPAAVRTLADAGISVLDVGGGGPSEEELPGWFELSKAALAHGLPLRWSGSLPEPARRQALHLIPPRDDAAWRARWRYGMLTWRRGPGFAVVENALERDTRHQSLLDLADVTALFGTELDRHVPAADLDADVVAELTGAGLMTVVTGRAVWLPYRMRRWPASPEA